MLMLGAGFINRFRTRVNRTRTGFSNNYGWGIIGGTWNIVARFRSFIGGTWNIVARFRSFIG